MKRSYAELMKEIKEKWTVENITDILDEMNIEYELVDEEGEAKVSINEMKEQNEIKYKLKHKLTGQYVSYLGIERYEKGSLLPEKIEAIEFIDDYEDAEMYVYKYTELDKSGKLKFSPMEKLELFYSSFFLDVVKFEEDKLYTFYSEDFDMYFDDILVEDYIDEKMVITLTSNNKGKPKGTNNPDVLHIFKSHTNFTRHEVSDLD